MKSEIYTQKGESKGKIDLPIIFEKPIREDIVQKQVEAEKYLEMQPYSPEPTAGKKAAASGKISHKRHDWKGHYGRGISRIPRKTMWRRGVQFYWIGATISSARGGRRAHPPKLIKRLRKINKKEQKLAFSSAIASTASPDYITGRYSTLDKMESAPFIIESLPEKTKDLITLLKKVLGPASEIAFKKKSTRAGKGKLRGRRNKSTAGALIITSSEEEAKFKGLDVIPLNQLRMSDLYPLGRLTVYTKKAIDELSKEDK